eukprot:TRINITY_DN5321_c0_g1_i1.p1 TRINITY_DN5321_c0_g1~~TRINITY_DN5321_c0_g1_i1.p1  ORF type:complete len:390 (-),score=81.54 TRINITY_DN5321_c0_g1_i1:7-1146(-)
MLTTRRLLFKAIKESRKTRANTNSGNSLVAVRRVRRNNRSQRNYYRGSHAQTHQNFSSRAPYILLAGGFAAASTLLVSQVSADDHHQKDEWADIRKDVVSLLHDSNWDDQSWGPVLVRLAWHASGTYDKDSKTGGSTGATMRFGPESSHGANSGLAHARERLEVIKKKHPNISYGDLWTFAGAVAIEEMGGPKIPWRPGRKDAENESACPPDGRLPDASKGASHVRDIFYRMGFDDREIVALVGAHALGRCHTDRSGYTGPWTRSPTTFSNDYFVQLLENKWTPKKWDGPLQYEDPSGELMMLPADLALIQDERFKKYVKMYAEDEDLYFKDFAAAFAKLMELGVSFSPSSSSTSTSSGSHHDSDEKRWWQKLFSVFNK